MNVVDSSGWLEYLTDGNNADNFIEPLNSLEQLIVPTICIYEVFKQILRQKGEVRALQGLGTMMQGQVAELNATLALNAANISHKLKIPMADSIILATARYYKAVLWTQDKDFEGLENVNYFEKS